MWPFLGFLILKDDFIADVSECQGFHSCIYHNSINPLTFGYKAIMPANTKISSLQKYSVLWQNWFGKTLWAQQLQQPLICPNV